MCRLSDNSTDNPDAHYSDCQPVRFATAVLRCSIDMRRGGVSSRFTALRLTTAFAAFICLAMASGDWFAFVAVFKAGADREPPAGLCAAFEPPPLCAQPPRPPLPGALPAPRPRLSL